MTSPVLAAGAARSRFSKHPLAQVATCAELDARCALRCGDGRDPSSTVEALLRSRIGLSPPCGFSGQSRGMTQDLRQHLWNCAEILRGSAVDRTDWKAYILPLLFFKRISDVWDEETADAATLFGDADPVDFPEVHRFSVPGGCHWRDVRETPANVGAALSH